MRQLNGVFTQKTNRRHGRVGHVFQGRFKAILVQKDEYLLELCLYVVLNPIRAHMVSDMLDWKWSSYLAMVGDATCSDWLETDWLLNHFGSSRQMAAINYANFVREGIGVSAIWRKLRRQVFLGDEEFVDKAIMKIKISDGTGDLREVAKMQRRAQAKPLSWYRENGSSRHKGIVSAYQSGDYSMKKIADGFDVHYSTVSRAIKKAEMLDCKTPFSHPNQ